MSERMTCPACGAYTSSVLHAFRDDEPCPHCGLSSTAASEILRIQSQRADDELKKRLATVLAERDEAQRKLRVAEDKLDTIREALEES